MKGDIPDAGDSSGATDKLLGVTLLLPVWGSQYVRRFLELCLPTLLSPKNIPALVQEFPCSFILLSSENDERDIVSHPAWQRLAKLCRVEILLIDDLITGRNHTATITLGFERVLRRANHTMRQTCFIFLMSDYLMADGSLASVLATIRGGARAVLAGNFQVVAEDALPLLRSRVDHTSSEIIFQPRDLIRLSIAHLHPATIANVVNFGLTHNAHCNRLFWQVDEDTIIGRFYLLHPIAIHPEVNDFIVGSSWDYSFIPELCPSGKVTTLTDSDQYLVIEAQGRYYEHEHLRGGPLNDRELARSLEEWTTERHRLNVEQKLIFHAGEPPADLPRIVAQSDAFVNRIRELLAAPPISHRNHPYWIGSMAAHRRDARRPLGSGDWNDVLNQRPKTPGLRAILRRLEDVLLRVLPDVTKLHPLWPDYRPIAQSLKNALESKRRVLLIAREPALFARWMSQQSDHVFTLSTANLLRNSRMMHRPLISTFDLVLFVIDEASLNYCDLLIECAAPLLISGGACKLLLLNHRPHETANEFEQSFTRESARLWRAGVSIEEIQYCECSPFRWFMREAITKARIKAALGSRLASYSALASSPILLSSYFANMMARSSPDPITGICSSILVALRFHETTARDLPSFEGRGDRLALALVGASGNDLVPLPDAPGRESLLTTADKLVRTPDGLR